MTFMATYNGRLEPGYVDGHARMKVVDGTEYYDWPKPWGFRCDNCGRDFPYGCVLLPTSRGQLRPPFVRQVRHEVTDEQLERGETYERQEHICAYCENGPLQLELFDG